MCEKERDTKKREGGERERERERERKKDKRSGHLDRDTKRQKDNFAESLYFVTFHVNYFFVNNWGSAAYKKKELIQKLSK